MLFKLKSICKGGKVLVNAPLKNLSTIKIGGCAKYLVYPISIEQVFDLLWFLNNKKINYYILGNGSNVLISNKKYNGVIICLKQINEIRQYNNILEIGAGAKLNNVVNFANNNGLKGMEDAIGIPGTIGGAVVMNASAYNFETKNVVKGVLVLRNNKIDYLTCAECKFGYRESGFMENDIILRVDLELKKGNKSELKKRSAEVVHKRLILPHLPNLGSIFKRDNKIIVSKVIDELGLKGLKVGDAMVSYEHAGIIVNTKNATSEDVIKLIKIIKEKCKKERGMELKEEIKFL